MKLEGINVYGVILLMLIYEKMFNLASCWGNEDKTTRYPLPLVRMAIINKTVKQVLRGCGEKGTPIHCWWKSKMVQPQWKTVWQFLKKIRNRITL